jgi:cell wall-associated NlpC family hydrolase
VTITAVIAVTCGLIFAATDASAQTAAATGGFSADQPPAAPAPPPAPASPLALRTAKTAMAADGRTAVAPAGAPAAVVKAVAAANRITRKPYKWGGGHGRWRDSGYDCSGTVSYVLHAAGLLKRPRDSSGFMSYGYRGKGKWISIYSHGGHAYMVIAGLRFDTSGRGENGPRWRPEPHSGRGFAVRHPGHL